MAFQLIRYGVVGLAATVLQVVVFYTLAVSVFVCLMADDWAVRLFGLTAVDIADGVRGRNFVACTAIGFFISNFFCWIMNRIFVFTPGKYKWHVELGLFYMASATAAVLAIGLSWVCINWLGLMTTLAVLIEIVVSFMVNYVVRKFFIFKG